jgi:hypothetical protein
MEPKPLPYAFVQRESGASLVAKAADLRRRRGLRAELMQQFKKTAVQLGARRHTCGGSEGDRSKALAVLLMRVLDSRLLGLVTAAALARSLRH